MDSATGRKEFEAEVNRFVKLYPGSVCKEGESFDFPAFYARRALANGQDLSKFGNAFNSDPELVAKVQKQLEHQNDYENPQVLLENKKGLSAKLGAVVPEFMREKFGKGLF